jgi:hypothetical protein
MTAQTKTPTSVKSDVIDLMKEHVYGGDFDRPRIRPDSEGLYHYDDRKIRISLAISPRDGWLSCSVMVWILRRRFLFTKAELVMSTGFGYDVSAFRPGLWCDHVSRLAGEARALQKERETLKNTEKQGSERPSQPEFSPVDDSSIFRQ